MNWRNRVCVYGSYICGTAGIGFTLPYLPVYLSQEGLSDRIIGWISTCAAVSGLAQFPIGIWSDRLESRKPFLLTAMGFLTLSALLLQAAHGAIWIGLLVILFAENGICRAVIDSLTGAEVTALARPEEVGAALGRLRTWKPIGIIAVAAAGSWWASKFGIEAILFPLTCLQLVGFVLVALIRDRKQRQVSIATKHWNADTVDLPPRPSLLSNRQLGTFVIAMVLFHAANAPGGVYLGLFLKREMNVSDSWLAYSFVISMVGWMLTVWPAGKIADRIGRKPLLVVAWATMTVRLFIVAVAATPLQIALNQFLDGVANGLFSVLAATWVTDCLADSRRNGEAQTLVGTALVFGSAIGPAISAICVTELGYRGLFACLAVTGALATAVVVFCVPESLRRPLPTEQTSNAFPVPAIWKSIFPQQADARRAVPIKDLLK